MIEFIYFDLGRVLLDFTHQRGFEQIAATSDLTPNQVKTALFNEQDLSNCYERGEITTVQFHERFCEASNATISLEAFTLAWSDIFTLLPQTIRLAAALRAAGHRIGILSNTCEAHWDFALARFRILGQIFDPVVTSYAVNAMKPDPAIYAAAESQAGCPAERIFFVDDRAENVEGARQAGWTTTLFTSPLNLAAQLEQLGVAFNR